MRNYLAALLGAVLVLLFAVPVTAQPDAPYDPEHLALIQRASANFIALESYNAQGTSLIIQYITLEDRGRTENVSQTITQELNGFYITNQNGAPAMSNTIIQQLETVVSGRTVGGGVTMDLRVVDETFYARMSNATGDLIGLYPSGWVNVSQDPTRIPGLELINAENYVTLIAQQYSFAEGTIRSIVELSQIEHEGNTFHRFMVEMDIDGLRASGELEQALGSFNLESLGLGADELVQAIISGMRIKYTVTVGAEELIYGAELDITTDAVYSGTLTGGAVMRLQQTIANIFTYGDFNGPFEVLVPEVGF